MEEAFANHKPFKTAKQIRAEKYGIDEDEEGMGRLQISLEVMSLFFDDPGKKYLTRR